MTDFHTHILPGIDDGSRNMEETQLLLGQEELQGVGRILATPHFYAGKESAPHFFEKREKALSKVRAFLEKQEQAPQIRAAAEVYYFPRMGEAGILPRLCMEGGRLLLVEMPFVQWTGEMYRDVEKIIRKQELTVMLAHVERYYGFQKDKSIWKAVFDLPLYAQINAGSLLRFGSRGFAVKFIKAGHKVLLGSDCHHHEYRPVNLEAGREVLRRKLGEEALEEMDRMGKELWEHGGEP